MFPESVFVVSNCILFIYDKRYGNKLIDKDKNVTELRSYTCYDKRIFHVKEQLEENVFDHAIYIEILHPEIKYVYKLYDNTQEEAEYIVDVLIGWYTQGDNKCYRRVFKVDGNIVIESLLLALHE